MKISDQLSAIIVGGGIAGSLCALFAAREGFQVTLIAKGADPRRSVTPDLHSSTFGGEDSRFVTITEGHPYLGPDLGKERYVNEMYPDMQGAFTKSIHDGGWLAQPIEHFHGEAGRWLARRYLENEKQAETALRFERYINENRESMRLWDQLLCNSPELKRGISLNNSGILRLYGSTELFRTAREFQNRAGVLLDTLTPDETSLRFPCLRESVDRGFIQGALVVEGLTFRVQTLVKNILNELTLRGAELRFDTAVSSVELNSNGEVQGLKLESGEILTADHYSLQLGAYDNHRLLGAFGLAGEIAGVAGGWIALPHPDGPFLPVKVHDGQHEVNGETRPVVDLNLNPATLDNGERVLIIGGGYLYVGMVPHQLSESAKKLMQSEIERVSELVLGEFFRLCERRGLVQLNDRTCVRSFTPSDEELSLAVRTDRGGVLTVGGGGNTGTTAKAAWIARETVQKFITSKNNKEAAPQRTAV